MFTGIITGVGRIVALDDLGGTSQHGKRLHIEAPAGYLDDVAVGDSVALQGACMTATAVDAPAACFSVEISAHSLALTAGLGRTGAVNLEKALRPQDRLGGHVVTGHVDAVAEVVSFTPTGESWTLQIAVPVPLQGMVARKGSLAVDGVSLTINAVEDTPQGCRASFNLIAHTLAHTTLGGLKAGSRVNLEVDLMARYVQRLLQTNASGAWETAA